MEEQAEVLRKRQKYRELILDGKLSLPHARAAMLLGPDCLYQLYGLPKHARTSRRKKRTGPRKGTRHAAG
jgi:hypothetical protein